MQIPTLLEQACSEHVFSGYQMYAERKGTALALHGGRTSYWPEARPVEAGTRFDIGSVTKAVVTTSLFARGLQAGRFQLSDPLQAHLPEFGASELGKRTLGEFLNHCTGLTGWLAIYLQTDREGFPAWLRSNAGRLLEGPARSKTVYSDVGFLTLGLVLERLYGDLRKAFQDEVAGPLGVTETDYGPVADRESCAATEVCLWRGRLLQGDVFDENCFALGGVCSHAGLFATARGLAPWAREWLRAVKGESRWLRADLARLMTRPAGLVKDSTWGYGWDTKSKTGSTAGDLFSLSSFGHLGYPGCSIWIDPDAEGFAIFHTNRIHPSRWDERIRSVRPRLHDEIAKWWSPK